MEKTIHNGPEDATTALNKNQSALLINLPAPIHVNSNARITKNKLPVGSRKLTREDVLRYINGDDSDGYVPVESRTIDEDLQKLPTNEPDEVQAEFSEDDPNTWAVKPFIPVTALDWRIRAHHDAMQKMNDLLEYLEITKLDKSERDMWGKLLKKAFKLTLRPKR